MAKVRPVTITSPRGRGLRLERALDNPLTSARFFAREKVRPARATAAGGELPRNKKASGLLRSPGM